MSRIASERVPALRSAPRRGEVPASGWSPGAGEGVRMNPYASLLELIHGVPVGWQWKALGAVLVVIVLANVLIVLPGGGLGGRR